MDFWQRTWNRMQQTWGGMGAGARVAFIAFVASIVAVGYFGYRWYQPSYVAMVKGAPLEEVGLLTARLTERKIPYRLEDGGATITVPLEKLAEARVDAASANLPTGANKGFEFLDNTSTTFGMTPATLELYLTRALQTELSRSISQMKPIAQARVHIVRPTATPFLRDKKATTASAVLKLKPGAILDRGTADAIVALMSRAIEGLTPDNVSVVDTDGRLLTQSKTTEERIPDAQLEFRKQLETYLASKAEAILRQRLGANRAVIQVSADINFQREKVKSETYSPDGKVAIADRQITQKTTSPGGGSRGVVGATPNVTRASAQTGGAGASGTSTTENVSTDYLVSKTSRELDNHDNRTNRLTIAAMVDLSDQEGTTKLTLADAQELIKQAIGFRENRDQIKVSDVKLGESRLPPAEEGTAQPTQLQATMTLIRNISLGVGLLLLLTLGMLVGRRMLRAKAEQAGAAAQAPTPASQAQTSAPQPEIPSEEVDEFRRLVEEDPERVAEILSVLLRS